MEELITGPGADLQRPRDLAPEALSFDARELSQGYGRNVVLTGLDLQHGRTGALAVLGPNGAGKSTLLQTLATVTAPTAGTLRVLGLDVGNRRQLRQARKRLGYLPQRFGYYAEFTVLEFVSYVAWLREFDSRHRLRAARRAVDLVGLTEHADAKMKTLSGGMLRRAGIASAVVNEPDLVILDEPTVGLDPKQRLVLYDILRQVAADRAVVFSTHLVDDVRECAESVTVLNGGKVPFAGSAGQMTETAGVSPGDLSAAYIALTED